MYAAARRDVEHVAVVGLGYVGLPTALLAAQAGCVVHGVDIDGERVARIMNGTIEVLEADMAAVLAQVKQSGRFTVATTLLPAHYFIICVPTPLTDGKADVSAVVAAGDMVARVIKPGAVVILESTVPVGATEALAQQIGLQSGLRPGSDFAVAHCPERVLPGNIAQELINNDRLIGGLTSTCAAKAAAFYQLFAKGKLHLVAAKVAEVTKLVENSFRDVQLAFANQVAMVCDELAINVHEVIALANQHPRVAILKPGPGVGGHCVAVDPWFLIQSVRQEAPLLRAARALNDDRPCQIIEQVRMAVDELRCGDNRLPRVALLGVTYKPDVPDLRSSPALKIASALALQTGFCELMVCDPCVEVARLLRLGLPVVPAWHDAVAVADLVVLLVAHQEFKQALGHLVRGKRLIDPTGFFYQAAAMQKPIERHCSMV